MRAAGEILEVAAELLRPGRRRVLRCGWLGGNLAGERIADRQADGSHGSRTFVADDAAVFQTNEAARAGHDRRVMRREQKRDGAFAIEPLHQVEQQCRVFRVEIGRRLVGQNEVRFRQDRAQAQPRVAAGRRSVRRGACCADRSCPLRRGARSARFMRSAFGIPWRAGTNSRFSRTLSTGKRLND